MKHVGNTFAKRILDLYIGNVPEGKPIKAKDIRRECGLGDKPIKVQGLPRECPKCNKRDIPVLDMNRRRSPPLRRSFHDFEHWITLRQYPATPQQLWQNIPLIHNVNEDFLPQMTDENTTWPTKIEANDIRWALQAAETEIKILKESLCEMEFRLQDKQIQLDKYRIKLQKALDMQYEHYKLLKVAADNLYTPIRYLAMLITRLKAGMQQLGRWSSTSSDSQNINQMLNESIYH
ncbi:hypothetical protein SK128_026237 [Halocaridina rubra]|uniref:Uncharacterized protein n=1 Tax=Halocaridina rubra TaxID=373956 RepID=A0AAN8XL59_HALRR